MSTRGRNVLLAQCRDQACTTAFTQAHATLRARARAGPRVLGPTGKTRGDTRSFDEVRPSAETKRCVQELLRKPSGSRPKKVAPLLPAPPSRPLLLSPMLRPRHRQAPSSQGSAHPKSRPVATRVAPLPLPKLSSWAVCVVAPPACARRRPSRSPIRDIAAGDRKCMGQEHLWWSVTGSESS